VGIGTAAFGMEILLGHVAPGVVSPIEMTKEQRRGILERAKRETSLWEV
jgi:hypothetical protein